MLTVPVDDRGYTLGHGLFETVLCAGGELVWWEDHLARLSAGCAVVGLQPPDPIACRAAAEAAWADAGRPDRAAVRLNWSAGSGGRGLDLPEPIAPRLTASAASAPQPSGPLALVTARTRRNERSPASRVKSMSYLDNVLARAEAREAGADEALMLNSAGDVACAAAGNLFWLTAGELCTPALDCGVLAGLTRQRVVQAALGLGLRVAERRVSRDALNGRALFITNSLVGVRHVSRLDGEAVPSDPVIQALSDLLALP